MRCGEPLLGWVDGDVVGVCLEDCDFGLVKYVGV